MVKRIKILRSLLVLAAIPIVLMLYFWPANRSISELRDSGGILTFKRNPDSSIFYRICYGTVGYPALGVRRLTLNQQSFEHALGSNSLHYLGKKLSVRLKEVDCSSSQLSRLLSFGNVKSLTFVDCDTLPAIESSEALRKLSFKNCTSVTPFSELLSSALRLDRLEVDTCSAPELTEIFKIHVSTLVIRNTSESLTRWLVQCSMDTKTVSLTQIDAADVLGILSELDSLVLDRVLTDDERARLISKNPSIQIIETVK